MLQVIGAGLGRTGTHTLAFALDKLGFGPCYTIHDVDRNAGHGQLWTDALEERTVDWNALFQGYRAAVEWPTVAFLPQLVDHFPRAKVILTVRDAASWYASAAATIFPALEATAKRPGAGQGESSAFIRRLILEHVFANQYWDKARTIRVYQHHVQAVTKIVPADRLLHYRVQDGWAPLCAFLDVPAPTTPFPKRNDRATFLAAAPAWAKQLMAKIKQEHRNQ